MLPSGLPGELTNNNVAALLDIKGGSCKQSSPKMLLHGNSGKNLPHVGNPEFWTNIGTVKHPGGR
jgi:hypothetical protein